MKSDDGGFKFNLKLLQKLYRVRLLTVGGLARFVGSVFGEGVNLMALLGAAAKLHNEKIALVDEREEISYKDLYRQAQRLANALASDYQLTARQKTAFVCRNHTALVTALFAVSRLGADIYLLNPEMSQTQFDQVCERHQFDLIIYDSEVSGLIVNLPVKIKAIASYDHSPSIQNLAKTGSAKSAKLKKTRPGNLVVLTGGTTGQPKAARRKPSVFNFLNPFFALLVKLDLDVYKTAYIATPAYHGFGLASVLMSLILGIKMFLLTRFDAQTGCELIAKHNIEIVTLVPLMLHKMTDTDAAALNSLRCIISGGARLNPTLVEQTFEKLGDKLFNLYGTSEAGFSIMATPADLRYNNGTIGKKINGVGLKVLDSNNNEVGDGTIGRICLKSKWSIGDAGKVWVETGDMGFRDRHGYYFLAGRTDEMIVSAGENVYPVELETLLIKHPEVEQVAVIGIPDQVFGQRLKAFVVLTANSNLNESQIISWLAAGRAARFQMPASVVLMADLPVTSLGKPDKKALS